MVIGVNPYADFEGREEKEIENEIETPEAIAVIPEPEIDTSEADKADKEHYCLDCPHKNDCLNKACGRMCRQYYLDRATSKAKAEGKGFWGQWRARSRESRRLREIEFKLNLSDTVRYLDRLEETYTEATEKLAAMRFLVKTKPFMQVLYDPQITLLQDHVDNYLMMAAQVAEIIEGKATEE